MIYLDIGCGIGKKVGEEIEEFPEHTLKDCYAIGIDVRNLSDTWKEIKRRKPNVEFIRAYVGPLNNKEIYLPFRESSFDIISIYRVLGIPGAPGLPADFIMPEIKRVLKPNGKFYVSVPLKGNVNRESVLSYFGKFHWLKFLEETSYDIIRDEKERVKDRVLELHYKVEF